MLLATAAAHRPLPSERAGSSHLDLERWLRWTTARWAAPTLWSAAFV
jgi:hypothetical protein